MKNVLGRMIGLALVAGASMTMVVACGGSEEKCGDNERLATLGGGEEQCYPVCVDGACATGNVCNSGLCVPATTDNNDDPNNDDPNNDNPNSEPNSEPNNDDPNNDPNNGDPNNDPNNNPNANPGCKQLNLGTCEPLCDPTGCGADQACVIGQESQNGPIISACQPAGTAGAGEACGQTTACQAGLLCVGSSQDDLTCREMCDVDDAAACGADGVCGPLQGVPGLGACFPTGDECDLLDPSTCGANEACFPTDIGLQCVPSDGKALGEACAPPTQQSTSVECVGGAVCAGPSAAESTCLAFCDTAGAACAAGSTCQAQPQLGGTFGICVPD